jgi:outer membrane protein assembly factor BamB
VYTLGATGRLLCLNGADGKLLWQKDLLQEYGVSTESEFKSVSFGRSNSPLCVDDLVVAPAGGTADRRVSLVAYRAQTGEKVWEAGGRQISYSSPALATLAGVRQIVSVNEDTVSGHEVGTGQVLWEQAWPGGSFGPVSVAQPAAISPNRVFVAKSYGTGSAVYEISPAGPSQYRTREIWKSNRVMRTRFTNAVVKDGYAYGLSDGILECIRLEDGERAWKDGRYGNGQILLVGDSLLVMSESGEVVLVEASPDNTNKVLGRFQALDEPAWNNPALYGEYLLVRNAKEAACFRLALLSRQ